MDNKRKTYIDWQSAEQRMAHVNVTESSLIVVYTKGVIAVGLVCIFAWMLWAMTKDEAMVLIVKWFGG